jgi:hypothetical protein
MKVSFPQILSTLTASATGSHSFIGQYQSDRVALVVPSVEELAELELVSLEKE